jgi:hypothetical protein
VIPEGLYDPRRVALLTDYLMEEFRMASAARKAKEQNWIDFLAAYHGAPIDKEKNFPFKGASNLVCQVIGTDVDTMFARMMGFLFEPDNLWSSQATMPEMEPFAPRAEEFLRWAQHHEMELQGPIGDFLLELFKLGTGVVKQRYERETKKVFEWRETDQGTFQQQVFALMKDAPAVSHVRLFNFFIPPGFRSIQTAPWVAEEIPMTWQRYVNRVKAGIYLGNDRLVSHQANSRGNDVQRENDRISGYVPSRGQMLPLHEFWLDFDIDGDGWDEALVCTYHVPTQTYVRLDLNPFFNQDKPYSSAVYMRDENSFYGKGVAEMGLDTQEEVTAMHNQRLDNGTITNSTMYAVRDDETGVAVDEKLWPGKQFRLSNIEGIKELKLGNPSAQAASIENEQFTLGYNQRRIGTNDVIYGQQSTESTYATAFTANQIAQNATKRQGEVLRSIRNCLSETGVRVLELYQQFNPGGKVYFAVGLEDAALVSMLLKFPLDLIRKGLRINVTAIDVQQSKDMRIRTNSIIMQQLMQFYQQYLQAAMMATNPQVPPVVQQISVQMMEGGSFLMRKILDDYGQQDVDKLVPDLENAIQRQQQQLAEIQRLIAVGSGQGGPAGPQQQPGISGLLGPGSQTPSGPSPVPPQVGAGSPGGIQGPGVGGVPGQVPQFTPQYPSFLPGR